MISARSIALQGIGFGAMAAAALGYAQAQPEVEITAGAGGGGGGGGGSAGMASYRLPAVDVFDDEERIRAEIIREDQEILAVLMSAVTSGALQWVH